MQAINIYTGIFFDEMNGLMRDEKHKFNYREEDKKTTRSALIQSVVCASGLRKIPSTNINISYRAASLGSENENLKRIEASAQNKTIKLSGFVSTSISKEEAEGFYNKPVFFTFHNLRGAYIEPISQNPEEKEFLIPPTKVQLINYEYKNDIHYFEGNIVQELENITDYNNYFLKPKDKCLQYVQPKLIIELINNNDIPPEQALEAFPNNPNVLLACYKKDNSILNLIDTQHIIHLLEKKQIQPKDVLLAFPNNKEIINVICQIDKLISSSSIIYNEINSNLIKIKIQFIKTGIPPEKLIRDLFKYACKKNISFFSNNPYSHDTIMARYLIKIIKNDETLCQSFGIQFNSPNKTEEIKNLMELKYKDNDMSFKDKKFSSK